jgi:hypothetical protein
MSRDFMFVNCQDGEHKWKAIGGMNASCDLGADMCGCSVPVHECEVCGDCDYGDTPEADEIRSECRDTGITMRQRSFRALAGLR